MMPKEIKGLCVTAVIALISLLVWSSILLVIVKLGDINLNFNFFNIFAYATSYATVFVSIYKSHKKYMKTLQVLFIILSGTVVYQSDLIPKRNLVIDQSSKQLATNLTMQDNVRLQKWINYYQQKDEQFRAKHLSEATLVKSILYNLKLVEGSHAEATELEKEILNSLKDARSLSDNARMLARMNLAVTRMSEGKYEQAAADIMDSVQVYKHVNRDTSDAINPNIALFAYVKSGQIHTLRGRDILADRSYASGLAIIGRYATKIEPGNLAWFYVNFASFKYSLGEISSAERYVTASLDLITKAKDSINPIRKAAVQMSAGELYYKYVRTNLAATEIPTAWAEYGQAAFTEGAYLANPEVALLTDLSLQALDTSNAFSMLQLEQEQVAFDKNVGNVWALIVALLATIMLAQLTSNSGNNRSYLYILSIMAATFSTGLTRFNKIEVFWFGKTQQRIRVN